jgi:hypothetical protein
MFLRHTEATVATATANALRLNAARAITVRRDGASVGYSDRSSRSAKSGRATDTDVHRTGLRASSGNAEAAIATTTANALRQDRCRSCRSCDDLTVTRTH